MVRIPNDKYLREKGVIRDAKPCAKCCKTLLELGFRKIACSNANNEIEFGQTQNPQLWDYADNVDTVEFLLKT